MVGAVRCYTVAPDLDDLVDLDRPGRVGSRRLDGTMVVELWYRCFRAERGRRRRVPGVSPLSGISSGIYIGSDIKWALI
jgi:hypothetical protein